ncbi:MAG: hypothetical protein M3Z27_07385 [Actinomycetota bacterium]|nr:hypothetical protein [Actinomycetota bacterium]
MSRRRGILVMATTVVLAVAMLIAGAPAGSRTHRIRPQPPPGHPGRVVPAFNRYSIAGGCFLAHSASAQAPLRYAGPFRMQATALGQYLLYGPGHDFLGVRAGSAPAMFPTPSGYTVWRVDGDSGRGFTITDTDTATGTSVPVTMTPVPTSACADYPEGQLQASGPTFTGSAPQGTVSGTVDAHTHVTAFEFLGGDFHCGRPWHPFGIPSALPDCASVQQGFNGQVESFLDYGTPAHAHDTRGWPTFRDWPSPTDLAEEGDYYTGIKRAWMAGLRVMVTHLVDNEALCALMTSRRNPCDDMAAVRTQAADLRALQDYIDAQSGGPGKGFFRIVTNPFQARAAINSGKLAVIEGIEVSDLFHCSTEARCSPSRIDAGINEVKALGVSTFFPVHKFDNAFGGARMDGGEEGVLINGGNRLETGRFFDVQTCTGPERDNTQMDVIPGGGLTQMLKGGGRSLIPSQVLPVYPPAPHCNARGLSALGTYLINRMIQKHFIVEVDHMDVKTGNEALSILQSHHYSGVVSAHDWDDPGENTRIYNLGGFVTPIAGASPQSFVGQWQASLKIRNPRFYNGTGFGYGADMNGLAEQSQPTSGHPISYPFTSYDGRVRFGREQWGQRVFDLNHDGVANYGMYADWLQELQTLAGRPIMNDMFHGAEAYVQMWERAYGVPAGSCRPAGGRFAAGGIGAIRLGGTSQALLYAAGQPAARPGTAYRYCVAGARGAVATVFDAGDRVAMVASSSPGYRAGGVGPGTRVRVLRRRARRALRGVWLGRRLRGGVRFAYLVRRGKVAAVGVVSRPATRRGVLAADVRAVGL